MIVLTCIVVLLFSFIAYLLFAPFYFEVNSQTGLCGLRFHKVASATIQFIEDSIRLNIKVAGISKQLNLTEIPIGKNKTISVVRENKEIKSTNRLSLKKALAVLKTFRFNKCIIHIDTGDVQLNGILFPAFQLFAYYTNKNISINFIDENTFILELENNFARIAWAYINA